MKYLLVVLMLVLSGCAREVSREEKFIKEFKDTTSCTHYSYCRTTKYNSQKGKYETGYFHSSSCPGSKKVLKRQYQVHATYEDKTERTWTDDRIVKDLSSCS